MDILKDLIRYKGSLMEEVPTIDALHEASIDLAEKIFKNYGGLNSTWLMSLPPLPGLGIIETKWSSDREKDTVAAYLRHILKMTNASMYSFMSEGWQTNQPATADLTKVPRPSEDPKRIEVLLVDSFTRNDWRSTRYKILHKPDRLVNKEDHKKGDGMESEGRLWNLFLDPPTKH